MNASKVFTSENSIHFQVTCFTRLIFREIKDAGSGERSPPGKQSGLGGREAPPMRGMVGAEEYSQWILGDAPSRVMVKVGLI